jgi:DNA primase
VLLCKKLFFGGFMARITEAELERLKSELSLVRIIEDSGIELKARGKDYVACCPFHDDKTPSLVVTPAKNLFHCFGCSAAGGVIDWVMKMRGISFRHAVELLKSDSALVAGESKPIKQGTVPVLPAPVALDADEQTALNQVITYYHETLKTSPNALEYLASRGLTHPDLIDTFKLGYANRTLGLRLPDRNRKAGAEIRTCLEKVGIYRNSGHEHFSGSLVVPVLDRAGQVREVYGRKVIQNLRPGTPMHLYLPGQHAGVWNETALEACAGEVILCESLIDAMTFWVNGFRNVTASYGVNGFTDEMLEALKHYGIKRVLIAYDRDEAGDRAAKELAERLYHEGIGCFRILFPKSMDANEYALKMTPAPNALSLLIRKAEWMGEAKHSVQIESGTPVIESIEASSLAADSLGDSSSAKEEPFIPEPSHVSPLPAMPQSDENTEQSEHDLLLSYGERRYRIRGWNKPLNPESLKVNLLVSRGEHFHIDTFDLYHAKARAAFMKQASIELGEAEDVIKHDLGKVLLKLEELQSVQLQNALTKEDKAPTLSEADYAEAMAFLKSPDLMKQILSDFEACGVMGEETNKLVGYLAAVSRQLDKPLAVIIQSSSAAGKSSLMDAVLAFVPEEAQVRYSAMTGQSLFYMGDTNLKHKILAIAEEEGVSQAGYALKLLQSDGQVTIASTGKDPSTGRLVTQEYRVEGPVMLFLTTTAIDIDEELLNRCLVLTVNESREQTRAIHALQRKRQTLEGLLASEDHQSVVTLHRNAQRLLQPLNVVNPYADSLTFLDDKTRTRRDHMKYLTLIRAITLLHQYQRPIKTVQHRGKLVRYIEVEPEDIALANQLAHEVLGRTLDELPPQTRKLIQTVYPWIKEECARLAIKRNDYRFTRRQIRQLTGWGDTQLRVHLERLVQMEYLIEYGGRRGNLVEYELIYDGEGQEGNRFLMGLQDIVSSKNTDTNQGSRGEVDRFAGGSRPQSGSKAGGLRSDKMALDALSFKGLEIPASENAKKAHLPPVTENHHTVSVDALALSC